MFTLKFAAAATSTYAGLALFLLAVFQLLRPVPVNAPVTLLAALFG